MEWIGITISLASSSLASLGVNLQALGLQKENSQQEQQEQEEEEEPLLQPQQDDNQENQGQTLNARSNICLSKKKLWIVGFTLYIVFETFGSVIALAFISPVILAPLGASGLVFNAFWSKVFLGTRLSYLDAVGTGAIGIGTGLISWFGSFLPDGGKTVDDFIFHLSHPIVLSYFLVQFSIMLVLFLVIKYFEQRLEVFNTDQSLTSSSDFVQPTNLTSQDSLKNSDKIPGLVGILFSILGGIAASDTLLLTKTGIDMILFSIFNSNQFQGFISFLLLGLICFSVFLQLNCLNRALGYQEPIIVVPLFYSVYTCLSVLNTIVYLNSSEIDDYPILLVGLIFLMSGVWILRWARLKNVQVLEPVLSE